MECPKQQKFDYNLYSKDIDEEGVLMEFVEFKKHKSKKGNEIDVMILMGALTRKSDNKHIAGDFRIPLHTITNYDAILPVLEKSDGVNLRFLIKPDGENLLFLNA